MPLIETLGIILTTATAKTVARFVDEKISDYIRQKFGNKPTPEIAAMKKDIENLKQQLEAKDPGKVTADEVEELRKKVNLIEFKQSPLPADIISNDLFQKWSEKDQVPVEDQAMLVVRQIEVLIDRAGDLGVPDAKRFQLQQLAATIQENCGDLAGARFTARLSGSRADKDQEKNLGILLRKNLYQARDFLKGY